MSRLRVTVLLGLLFLAAAAHKAAAAPSCHTAGHAPLVIPDNLCTPGQYVPLTRAQVCTPKDRGSTPAAVRRSVLARYGVPNWSGLDGELDHRQPFFLGGVATARNLWPERGAIPNPKDRLEDYVRRRVCTGRPHRMMVSTARRIFAGNWVAYFRFYGLG